MPSHTKRAALSLFAACILLAAPRALPAAIAQPADDPGPATRKPADRRIDLRPKFKLGDQIRYTMNIDTSSDVKSPSLPELDQKQVMRQEIGLLIRVVEAGDEGATIELVYERVKVAIESDAITAEYDSGAPGKSTRPSSRQPAKKPASPPSQDPLSPGGLGDMDDADILAATMQGIVGSVMTIKLDSAGNIVNVSGGGSLTPPGGVGAIGGQGGGSWLVASPGQSGFANLGETWSTTSTLGGTPLGDFKMITNYTLRSASGGRANIAISGGIESNASMSPGGGGGGGGAQIKDARYSGSYVWDTQLGQLREMQTTQSATVDGSGMGVPMTMRTTSDVKVKKAR